VRIGEVAGEAGLATSTIRYYEELGLIKEPRRISGQRSFPPEAVQQLLFIKQAARLNFSLKEIKTFLEGLNDVQPHSRVWQGFAEEKIVELEAQILDLQTVLERLELSLSCACSDPTSCTGPTG
jgi:DNA-binding transcriptional MerR regulator